MKLCGFGPICRLYIVDSILHWRSHDAAIQGPRFMSQIEVPYGAAIWGPRCLCFAPDVIETYHILNRYSHLDGETTTIYHKFYFVILEILMDNFLTNPLWRRCRYFSTQQTAREEGRAQNKEKTMADFQQHQRRYVHKSAHSIFWIISDIQMDWWVLLKGAETVPAHHPAEGGGSGRFAHYHHHHHLHHHHLHHLNHHHYLPHHPHLHQHNHLCHKNDSGPGGGALGLWAGPHVLCQVYFSVLAPDHQNRDHVHCHHHPRCDRPYQW